MNPGFLAVGVVLVLVAVMLFGLAWSVARQVGRDPDGPGTRLSVGAAVSFLAMVGLALALLGVMFAGFEPK